MFRSQMAKVVPKKIYSHRNRYFCRVFDLISKANEQDMKKILVLGAGRSSAHVIRYLLENSEGRWEVWVADVEKSASESKIYNHEYGKAFALDSHNEELRRELISKSDIVISMLPASMHPLIATDCVILKKHLITPSYVSDEMWQLDQAAKEAGVLLLNEMGVDPGIDHMSAKKILDEIHKKGAKLLSFESYTGGLIAPESDNNPWNYKVTWNPRNVVLAGYGGTARYQKDGSPRYIPYHRLFKEVERIQLEGFGGFDGYVNRDSLKYKKIYNLEEIPTLLRGTLRREGFCEAWDALVQMGLTDDSFSLENPSSMTWSRLTSSFLDLNSQESLPEVCARKLQLSAEVVEKLDWLGIFDDLPLGIEQGSPAVALQKLIEQKWKLDEGDKDMIVMWHRFRYQTTTGQTKELTSAMVCLGEDEVYTAMSKTVGLPIAIAAKLILLGQLILKGVQLPLLPEIYEPVLEELAKFDIVFDDKESNL